MSLVVWVIVSLRFLSLTVFGVFIRVLMFSFRVLLFIELFISGFMILLRVREGYRGCSVGRRRVCVERILRDL